MQLWYGTFYVHQCKQYVDLRTRLLVLMHVKVPYHTCTYIHLPKDKPLRSKHGEDIKIKN